MQRLLIQLAGYWQAVANLITPNRCCRLGVLVTRNGAVIKTLALESLLQRSNRLIAAQQTDSAQRDDNTEQRSFHNRESIFDSLLIRMRMCDCAFVRKDQLFDFACAT